MLKVVVRLEKSITGEELNEDAADAPDIAWVAPSQIQYDFRRSVVPGGDDRGVVFVVEGRRSKVDQSDLGVKEDSPLACNALHGSG